MQYPENFINFSANDQLFICKQNFEVLYELLEISDKINQSAQLLIDNYPECEKYLDTSCFLNQIDKTSLLVEQMNKIAEEIKGYNEERTIKSLSGLLKSKVLYDALKSKEMSYKSIFKTINIVINNRELFG